MIKQQYYLEKRDINYSIWHRTLPNSCYAQDIDYVEYRFVNNEVVPVAIIETTVLDYIPANQFEETRILNKIIERLYSQSAQSKFLTHIAKRLNLPVYLVTFDRDLHIIYVLDMIRKEKWYKHTKDSYAEFLKNLPVPGA